MRVNPSSDSWSMEVMAWMRETSSLLVPKIVNVDVPALVSKLTEGSAAVAVAAPTTFCRHQVIVHVQEVRVHHRTPAPYRWLPSLTTKTWLTITTTIRGSEGSMAWGLPHFGRADNSSPDPTAGQAV
jgi:hypothetical protein